MRSGTADKLRFSRLVSKDTCLGGAGESMEQKTDVKAVLAASIY